MPADWSVESKVCVVTGASSGIGKEVARGLARQGARVALVCRSKERGEAARADLRATVPGASVDLLLADLFVQGEVRRVAREIDERYPQVNVLVNNAGLLIGRRALTPDGVENTFALNHLAYFLLTHLLLEKLKASAPARIVNTSSEAHWGARWEWDNLQGERKYSQLRAYCNSKLANLYFTFELARRLDGTSVTVNAVHPGFVRSRFGRTATPAIRYGIKLAWPFGISMKKGARTTLYAATAPELAGVTGKYLKASQIAEPSEESRDQAAQTRLWEISEEMTGVAPSA